MSAQSFMFWGGLLAILISLVQGVRYLFVIKGGVSGVNIGKATSLTWSFWVLFLFGFVSAVLTQINP